MVVVRGTTVVGGIVAVVEGMVVVVVRCWSSEPSRTSGVVVVAATVVVVAEVAAVAGAVVAETPPTEASVVAAPLKSALEGTGSVSPMVDETPPWLLSLLVLDPVPPPPQAAATKTKQSRTAKANRLHQQAELFLWLTIDVFGILYSISVWVPRIWDSGLSVSLGLANPTHQLCAAASSLEFDEAASPGAWPELAARDVR